MTGFWLLLLNGCGAPDGPLRQPMYGEITSTDISGDLKGTIAFLPSGTTKGPAANGLIVDGAYEFTSETGPVAGNHRVIIDMQPPTAKMASPAATSNLQWKFEFDVSVPSEGSLEQNFHLIRKTDADDE